MKQFIWAVGEMKNSVIYTNTDERHFRFSGGTWAWRNHNPGNVWAGSNRISGVQILGKKSPSILSQRGQMD